MMINKIQLRLQQKGQLALSVSCLVVLILFSLMLGGLSIDLYHMSVVRNELQAAVDSASLAGGLYLSNTDITNAEQRALLVAEQNIADGQSVSNNNSDVLLNISVIPASLDDPSDGQISVSVQKVVHHILAPLFGRNSDLVTASSVAAAGSIITTLGKEQLFPLVISMDAIPDRTAPGHAGAKPLRELRVGDTVFMDIGSHNQKIVGFTSLGQVSANTNYIESLIYAALGLPNKLGDFTMPSLKVGDQINLNNGNGAQHCLAREPAYSALLDKEYIVLPIVDGNPTFNQTKPVYGFLAVRVTRIELKNKSQVDSIVGQIVKPIVRGNSNSRCAEIPEQYRIVIQQLSPLSVHIVK